MRFVGKYRYALCFIAVLLFSCTMVLREYVGRETTHVQRREDFLLLHEMGRREKAARVYQLLASELSRASDAMLANDLQRTAMLVDPKQPNHDSLVWKYHVSVLNELRKRAERRVARDERKPAAE